MWGSFPGGSMSTNDCSTRVQRNHQKTLGQAFPISIVRAHARRPAGSRASARVCAPLIGPEGPHHIADHGSAMMSSVASLGVIPSSNISRQHLSGRSVESSPIAAARIRSTRFIHSLKVIGMVWCPLGSSSSPFGFRRSGSRQAARGLGARLAPLSIQVCSW